MAASSICAAQYGVLQVPWKAGRPLGSASSALANDGNCSKRPRSGLRLVNRDHIDCILCFQTPGSLARGVRRVLSGLDRDKICNVTDPLLSFHTQLDFAHFPSTKPIRACELEYIIRPASWTTDPRACSRDDGVVLISADLPSHSCRTSPPIYEEYAASGQVPVCANCRIRDWKACLPGTLRLWGSSCRAECRMLASSGCSALGPHEVNEGCICHEARWRYEPINRWREVIGSRARLRSGQHSTARDHVELEELSVSFRHGILRLEAGDGAALSSHTEPRSATTAVHLSMTDGLNGRSLASCLLVVGRPGKNKPRPHLFRLEHGKMFRVFLSPCQACLITLSRRRATS